LDSSLGFGAADRFCRPVWLTRSNAAASVFSF
jgi:hypothetical protein